MSDDKTIFLGIPDSVRDKVLPDPELLSYYRFAEHRVFFIDFEVDESLIEISKNIILINMADDAAEATLGAEYKRKPIIIPVYTYGGHLDAAYSFCSVCEASKTPVVTVNMGIAMSAGLIILLAGHTRFCMRGSQVLFHTGEADVKGTYEQLRDFQENYDKTIERMREYVLHRTKITSREFTKKVARDWYIDDKGQIDRHIVDKMIDTLGEVFTYGD